MTFEFEDHAPTSGPIRFDGDMLILPGHSSVEDGVLEFYPRRAAMEGRNAYFFWFSQSLQSSTVPYQGHWPPHEDLNDGVPGESSGKMWELWHDGTYEFPESNENFINYTNQFGITHYVERLAVGPVFQVTGAQRRRTSPNPNTGATQTLNAQSVCFWDLSNLPADIVVESASIIGQWGSSGPSVDTYITWITSQDSGPLGYPGWLGDYQQSPGTAFTGPSSAFNDLPFTIDFRHRLDVNGIDVIRPSPLLGFRIRFDLSPPPDSEDPQSTVAVFNGHEPWNEDWLSWAENPTLNISELPLFLMPALRIEFEPGIDDPITRHLARQTRARKVMI